MPRGPLRTGPERIYADLRSHGAARGRTYPAPGFILVGFFAVGDLANMFGSQNALVTVGKWVQMVALVVGSPQRSGRL